MDVLASQQQLQEQLALKEQENQQLVAQLQHLRTWMNALQQRARANDPHALLVARELYVGGVPEGTTEVRARSCRCAAWAMPAQPRRASAPQAGQPRLPQTSQRPISSSSMPSGPESSCSSCGAGAADEQR